MSLRYVLIDPKGNEALNRDGEPFTYSTFALAKLGRKALKSLDPTARWDIEQAKD